MIIFHTFNLFFPTNGFILNKTKRDWESELSAVNAVNSSSSCARLSNIQLRSFKDYTIAKKNSQNSILTELNVTSVHRLAMLSSCSCPKLSELWQLFFKAVTGILGINLKANPHVAIFGKPPDDNHAATIQSIIIAFSSLIAGRRILLLWISHQPPSFKPWLLDTSVFLKLEKIKFSLRGSTSRFHTHWRL